MRNIIFLNGCGSSGKTSIGRHIQILSSTPWILLGIDMFINMLPKKFSGFGENAKDGYFSFFQEKTPNGIAIRAEKGPLGDFFDLLPVIAELMVDQGNNLIIDEVILSSERLKSYADHLKRHRVYFIGVFCDLAEMQKREALRSDRDIGFVNGQIDLVHEHNAKYDFIVDTTHISASQSAQMILDFVDRTADPRSFNL